MKGKERKQRKALKTKPMSAYTAATRAPEATRPPGGLRQEAYCKGVAALALEPTQAASGAMRLPQRTHSNTNRSRAKSATCAPRSRLSRLQASAATPVKYASCLSPPGGRVTSGARVAAVYVDMGFFKRLLIQTSGKTEGWTPAGAGPGAVQQMTAGQCQSASIESISQSANQPISKPTHIDDPVQAHSHSASCSSRYWPAPTPPTCA